MAQTIKPDYSVAITGTSLFVKDKSGAYDAIDNPGGWGAPNPEIAESCVFAAVIRKASSGDEYLVGVSPDRVFDPLALNTKETLFEFTYKNDGAHEIYIGRLPVSDDGSNLINSAGTIPEDTFFYWDGKFWQLVDSVAVEKQMVDLINEPTVVQGLCEDIIACRLAIQKQSLYKDYRKNRELNCDDAEPIFQELLKLREDIQGSVYAYYSGLKIEAQDQIESLLDKYQLV
jgi:hypothetical protein